MGPVPTYDFTLKQGVPFTLPLTYRNPNNFDGSLGTPIDITGWTAHMQIRTNYGATEIITDLTDANDGVVLGGVAGTVTPTMTAEQTSALTFTTAVYDLFIFDLAGTPLCLVQGAITLTKQVTQ